MVTDGADLQVWFETQSQAGQMLLIPYVKSARDTRASYSLLVTKSGLSGNSRISQSGKIDAVAAQPHALSRLTLDVRKEDQCAVELTLRQGDEILGIYNFDCAR